MGVTRHILFFIFHCSLFIFLTGCVTSRKVNIDPAVFSQFSASQEYTLRQGDVLTYELLSTDGFPEKYFGTKGTFRVQEMGSIHIPLLGDIRTEDLTLHSLRDTLIVRFDRYFPSSNTYITVSLNNPTFAVISPYKTMSIPMDRPQLSLYEALALFGSDTDFGDRRALTLVRETEAGTMTYTGDLRSVDLTTSPMAYVLPGDVIYIPKMKGTSFGMNNVTNTIAITASTLSFAGLIGAIVTRIVNKAKE